VATARADGGWRPAGAVALSAGLWGLWWLPLRALAEAGLSGPAVNAALYGIASVALLPWYWRRRLSEPKTELRFTPTNIRMK
jgi:hypothetical protein